MKPSSSKKGLPRLVQRFVDWFTCCYDPALEHPKFQDGRPMPSLRLGLDLMRDKLSYQMAHADAVDTKASFVLGSASVITVVLLAWRKLPANAPGIVQWLPAIAIGVYIAVVAFSAGAYFLRRYATVPDPLKMRDEYVFWEGERTEDEFFHAMVLAWLYNKRTIGTKLHWLLFAFIALGIQILVVAAIVVVEVATISASS